MTEANQDLDVDQRLLFVAAEIGRRADRWWWRMLLGHRLEFWQDEINAVARDARRMRRALDEIVDDANEQAKAALARRKSEVDAMCLRVTAELDHIVARHSEGSV